MADESVRLLGRYEFGALDDEERRIFERHLLECDDCFAELERGSLVITTMLDHAPELAQVLRESETRRPAATRAEESLFREPLGLRLRRFLGLVPRPGYAVAVAAILIVTVVGIRQLVEPPDPARFATFPREETATDLVRGPGPAGLARDDATRELLETGAAHYDLGQWAEAEVRFRAALDRDPGLARASYFVALCRIHAGAPEEAIPWLERAVGTAGDDLRPRAIWALANTHLASGDVAAARRALDRLASTEEYGERARNLLDRLAR